MKGGGNVRFMHYLWETLVTISLVAFRVVVVLAIIAVLVYAGLDLGGRWGLVVGAAVAVWWGLSFLLWMESR